MLKELKKDKRKSRKQCMSKMKISLETENLKRNEKQILELKNTITEIRNRCCCCCSVASVMSNSVQSHRQQPTRLPCPWDSPGKNTGVGCQFLLQYMKVKSESEVAQLIELSNPTDCSPQGSSVHRIFQARVLEWVAITFS